MCGGGSYLVRWLVRALRVWLGRTFARLLYACLCMRLTPDTYSSSIDGDGNATATDVQDSTKKGMGGDACAISRALSPMLFELVEWQCFLNW